MSSSAEITLSYDGAAAENHELDFYDASVALLGFQRSLAIVTHLVINGEIITQAPALKNARILAVAPQQGSWELPALVLVAASAFYKMGTAPKDTPIGHLIRSAYDFVVARTLGFHVNYDETLGEQYEKLHGQGVDLKVVRPSQLDSAIEKAEVAIRDMHRPIIFSQTAKFGQLYTAEGRKRVPLESRFTPNSYAQMIEGLAGESPRLYRGRVSSYNVNTYKGRVYLESEGRPVPFELQGEARIPENVRVIAQSLAKNASARGEGKIDLIATPYETRTGRLKSLRVLNARVSDDSNDL